MSVVNIFEYKLLSLNRNLFRFQCFFYPINIVIRNGYNIGTTIRHYGQYIRTCVVFELNRVRAIYLDLPVDYKLPSYVKIRQNTNIILD